MAGRRFRRDDSGASAIASFLVALGFFSMTFATSLLFVAQVGGRESGQNEALQGEAAGILDILTSSPGSPPSWTGAVPSRLGLIEEGRAATLDMDKVASVRAWTAADYDAARTALGIPTREFFLRTYPAFGATATANASVGGIRTAYVGDYENTVEQPSVVAESKSLDDLPLVFSNKTVDRSGAGLPGDKFEDQMSHMTRNLAPRLAGFPTTIDVDTGASNDGYWKVVNVNDYGAPGYLSPGGSHVLTASNWVGTQYAYQAFSSGSLISEDAVTLPDFDLRNYTTGASIKLSFTHFANGYQTLPTGINPATDDYGFVTVKCIASCRTGDDLLAIRGGNHVANGTKATFQATAIDLSAYHGETIRVTLVWHSVLALTAGEGWFIGPLALKATASGTTSTLWKNDLDYSTTLYDALVVGSGVAQSALDDGAATGGVFKNALKEWLVEGGYLLAFGSDSATNGWLNPTFTTGSAAKTTGPALLDQSDLSHPILNTPYRVRPGDLAAADKTYRPQPSLQSIVLIGEQGGGTLPLLAVSKPSALYDGVAILTGWQPAKLGNDDRQNLIVNMLLYAKYNLFYLDYGHAGGVPYGGAVHSAGTTVIINAEAQGLGVRECEIMAFVW